MYQAVKNEQDLAKQLPIAHGQQLCCTASKVEDRLKNDPEKEKAMDGLNAMREKLSLITQPPAAGVFADKHGGNIPPGMQLGAVPGKDSNGHDVVILVVDP